MSKIMTAKGLGQEWIETSPEIIKTVMPRGLGGARYFIYQGIKVCEYGQTESIVEECNTPLHLRIYPENKGVTISGG